MSEAAAALGREGAAPRWPGVLGVVGIVLAVLTLLDKAGDLLVLLLWTEKDWIRVLGPQTGQAVAPMIPPAPWLALTALVWSALAVLLLVGSLRLRRRRPSGIELCRLWSWLAIAWFALEMAVGLWWLQRIAPQLAALVPGGWHQYAVVGILMAVVLMLAYPVFLLVWFSRPSVRRDAAGWRSVEP